MAKYIDSHAHLFEDQFKKDLPEVIQRAKDIGCLAALVVAIRSEDFPTILDLSDKYPDFCLPCFGIHPVQGDPPDGQRSVNNEDLGKAITMIEEHHEKLVAIGEVGLDFTPRFCKTPEDKEIQRDVLRKQVELAKRYQLPLNVHSRSAGRPTIQLLRESGAENVLLHAFDGRPAVAMEGVEAGYYFSIPPSIVRSQQKQKLVERIPLENMCLETDSPALGPIKQERNEPQNVTISCEYIAKIKKMDPASVAKVLFENTIKLFPKIVPYISRK